LTRYSNSIDTLLRALETIMGDILQADQYPTVILPDLLSVEQLSALLHKSPASIRSDASRNPQALPPICRLPGNKRLLWRWQDVRDWVAKYVEKQPGHLPASSAPSISEKDPRTRGRPRKTAMPHEVV
jgi:hypothetical protein